MSPRLRRAIGLVAVPGIAFTTLAALPTAPAHAAEVDPAPLDAGAPGWRTSSPTGLVHNDQFDSTTTGFDRVDAGLAAGGSDGTVQTSSTRSVTNVAATSLRPLRPSPRRRATAPRARRVARQGGWCSRRPRATTPRAFGGRRPRRPSSRPGRRHRPGRRPDPGRAPASVRDGLRQQSSARRSPCSAPRRRRQQPRRRGGHRVPARPAVRARASSVQDFAAIDAADQSCDADPAAQSSTDVTALAVLALLPQADDTDRRRPRSTQRPTGCSTSRQPTGRSAPARTSRRPTPTAPVWPAGRSARPATSRRRSERPHGCAAARPTRRHRAGQR